MARTVRARVPLGKRLRRRRPPPRCGVPRIHWYSLYDLPREWEATTRHREGEGSSVAPHHTSAPRDPQAFADFCALMVERYAAAAVSPVRVEAAA